MTFLRLYNFQVQRKTYIIVHSPELIRTVKQFLRMYLQSYKHLWPDWSHFHYKTTQVVLKPHRRWRQYSMNVQRYIMNFDHARIANVSKKNQLLPQCAVDLICVPLNTNFLPTAIIDEGYYSAIFVLGKWISSITGFSVIQG